MSFQGVLTTLNSVKEEGVIEDYAIAGAYAVIYYFEPFFTSDIDIIVLLGSQDDFHKLNQYFDERDYKREGIYIRMDGKDVQFFAGYGGDLYEEAVRHANSMTVEGIPSKVVSREYLIALLLKSNRPKDKIRIVELLPQTNTDTLNEILRKHDNAQDNFQIKYQRLLKTI
ncbi:hypothetical protein ES703_110533 [subsurface metagenome]